MNEHFFAKATNLFFSITFLLVSQSVAALEIPQGLETLTGEEGSQWERVNEPGFGNRNNIGIVALYPYKESLYALTRNDTTGFEMWKTAGAGWVRVMVPGFTDNSDFFGWLKPGNFADQYDIK